jgi:hypothetical protein
VKQSGGDPPGLSRGRGQTAAWIGLGLSFRKPGLVFKGSEESVFLPELETSLAGTSVVDEDDERISDLS